MSVQFTILGSGSSGNSAFLEVDDTRLLIDAGLSARQIRQRLEGIGRSLEMVNGILITHEHTDHIHALTVLCSRLAIPIYCNRLTQEAIAAQVQCAFTSHLFQTGDSFEIGAIRVDSFSVPHDAQDPAGFLLHTTQGKIGFLTDLGHVTKLVIQRVQMANVLVLETNHDVKMLQDHPWRPWSLKQRILSRHGHLSNEAAAAAAEQIASADLKHLYLGHLSQDCNRPELALQVIAERLHKIGAAHIQVEVTQQKSPNPTLVM